MICPCNPSKKYINCCAVAHNNIHDVKTAEQLMRSRYSAFVLKDMAYLKRSHHSRTRPSKREYKEMEKWTKSLNWIRLEVLETTDGNEHDLIGAVVFNAYFFEEGMIQEIHENSRFCKEYGHWVYVDKMSE